VCVFFAGLGFAMVGISALVSVYYNVILGLSVFYLFSSFTSELPWSKCGHWWNQYCSDNPYGWFPVRYLQTEFSQLGVCYRRCICTVCKILQIRLCSTASINLSVNRPKISETFELMAVFDDQF